GDQFDAHPNPQPGNMNGWVDDDDDVKEEDDENEDVDIEEDDDVEIIFPYEVQGDQTPPPRDESSDSDFEPEAEDADDEPEAEDADDKPEVEEADNELEVEEAGVEPEAEGDDVEEAESETGRTEVALLGSEAKIRKMEREILHHDLSSVEEALGKVVERLKVLESEENATLRKFSELTWWNGRTKAMGIEAANNTPWSEVRKWMTEELCPQSVIQRMEQELYNLRMKGMDINGYTNRFHELGLLCPRMVEPEAVKVEQYIRSLTKSIRGDVTSSQPATINDAVRLAYQLVGQLIQDKADEATEGEKRKGESDRGGRGDNQREHNRRQNQRRGNAGAMTNAAPNNNETCQKCKNKRHAGDCWKKRDCPKLGKNGQGGNNRRGVYQLGAVNAHEDPKVVTEMDKEEIIVEVFTSWGP
nr:hypothetical protein [Tanacetum cinerariifolium]